MVNPFLRRPLIRRLTQKTMLNRKRSVLREPSKARVWIGFAIVVDDSFVAAVLFGFFVVVFCLSAVGGGGDDAMTTKAHAENSRRSGRREKVLH